MSTVLRHSSTKWLVLVCLLAIYLIVEIPHRKPYQKLNLERYSDEEICEAIYKEEGGKRTRFPYGISKSFCDDRESCKTVCKNTIRNTRRRISNSSEGQVFKEELAKRYCPYNQKTWIKNVEYFIKRGNN